MRLLVDVRNGAWRGAAGPVDARAALQRTADWIDRPLKPMR